MGKYTSDVVLAVAAKYVGYLEKKSAKYLDDMTKNAGYNNYTKFARDYKTHTGLNLQGQPWCDMFVDECMIEAYGLEKAKEMLGGFSAYTPTSANMYKAVGRWTTGTPKPGYQIFFKNSSRICHTGFVERVTSTMVYTIEGNTSSAAGVIANGGSVARKSYKLNYSRIAGYGIPNYSDANALYACQDEKAIISTKSYQDQVVKCVRTWLNDNYGSLLKTIKSCNKSLLPVNGNVDVTLKRALTVALQYEIKTSGTTEASKKLVVDGFFGDKTYKVCPCIKKNQVSNIVKVAESILYCTGFNPNDYNGTCTDDVILATKEYQAKNDLTKDGLFGKNCFDAFLR